MKHLLTPNIVTVPETATMLEALCVPARVRVLIVHRQAVLTVVLL